MKAKGPSGCPFGSALPRAADQAVRWADAVLVPKVGCGHAIIAYCKEDASCRSELLIATRANGEPSAR